MPDLNDPRDMPELRRTLRDAGIDPDPLTDDDVRDEMRRLLDDRQRHQCQSRPPRCEGRNEASRSRPLSSIN